LEEDSLTIIRPQLKLKVRPELQWAATFAEASTIPNLNADEAEFFKKSFYLHSKLQELQQEEGRKTRTNKTGIRSFLTKKKETPNRRMLLSLLIILCALPVFHVGAADVQPVSEFNLVFEEIGLMASATDYQLATMKVNLTKLENTVLAFKQTVILQHELIDKVIPIPELN
jgi:hypothetical protein